MELELLDAEEELGGRAEINGRERGGCCGNRTAKKSGFESSN